MRLPRLLLIEDNPGDIELIRRAFQHHDFAVEIDAVRDGEMAIERIAKVDQGTGDRPDGVLLDLSLPKIDGIEVLRRIRSSPVCGSLPVLVLSGSDNPEDKARMLAAGANRYVVKPSGLYAFLQIGIAVKEMLGEATRLP